MTGQTQQFWFQATTTSTMTEAAEACKQDSEWQKNLLWNGKWHHHCFMLMLSTLQIFCFTSVLTDDDYYDYHNSQCQRSINFNLITECTVSLFFNHSPGRHWRLLADNKFCSDGKIVRFNGRLWQKGDGKLNWKSIRFDANLTVISPLRK